MTWSAEIPIKISGGSVPKSIKGPTITQWSNTVFMAYVGEGGERLYTCQCDASTGFFDNWSGNKRVITSSGEHLNTKDRPSIYVPLTEPAIVFIDHDTGHIVQTERAGGVWNDPSLISDFSGYDEKWNSPLISIAGLKTVLFALDGRQNPWYAFQVFQWDISEPNFGGDNPWTTARPFPRSVAEEQAQHGAVDWFASAYKPSNMQTFPETVYGVSREKIFVYQTQLVYDPAYEYPWNYLGSIDLKNTHISITDTSSGTIAVFGEPSSNDLSLVFLDPSTLSATGLTKIAVGGSNLSSDQAPNAIFFQPFRAPTPFSAICVGYKKENNHDLCFAANAI